MDNFFTVKILSKPWLQPRYGRARKPVQEMGSGTIEIREDLPPHVQAYIFAHELYHLRDDSKHWLWREIKATVAGVVWPIMGLARVLLDFVVKKDRREFLIKRFRDKR